MRDFNVSWTFSPQAVVFYTEAYVLGHLSFNRPWTWFAFFEWSMIAINCFLVWVIFDELERSKRHHCNGCKHFGMNSSGQYECTYCHFEEENND